MKSGKTPSKILVTEKWINKNQNLSKKVDQSLITLVSEEVLVSAISTINPDGIAALVEISSIPKYQFNSKDDFVLILDRVQDPGNLGNLFRTALAAGVNSIFLAGGAHPLSQKVLRASSGAVFHLPFQRFEGTEEEIISALLKSLSELSNLGFKVFSTSSNSKDSKKFSKPYWEIDWNRPTALILGNEGQGIHRKVLEAFNETISIPHCELVESLNVACVAVPLLLERKRVAYTSNT